MPASSKKSRSATARGEHARPWLLAAFVAASVARPLVPSEGVAWLGDGHSFTMLLLMLTAGLLIVTVRRGGFTRSFHWVDAAVGILVLVCVSSSLLGLFVTLFRTGSSAELSERVSDPRVAINMTWEWVGLGLVYFLTRQLVATLRETRALVAIMIALAAVMSAYGLYQVLVALPGERAAYRANPDQVLSDIGQWSPEGSPERARFEDRLNSSEPMGTFALANSLAGFLVTWLVLAVGVLWQLLQDRLSSTSGKRAASLAILGLGLTTMLVCLVLTKSRSAYLALLVGLALLPLASDSFRRAFRWQWAAAGAALLVLVVAAAALAGGLDVQVLTEASKSLEYRFQYWQATLDMIARFPILGVGAGEFQDYYTQFKLPQASEEIRDPHNFLLEIWATGGTFGLLAMAAVLAAFGWRVWERYENERQAEARPADEPVGWTDATWTDATPLMIAGALVALPLAFVAGLPFGYYLSGLHVALAVLVGGAMIAAWWVWISAGTWLPRLAVLGVLVLAINWLAAGGLTFPGVAGTFWMLMALAINDPPTVPIVPSGMRRSLLKRLAPAIALGCTIGAAVGCYYSAFLPVLRIRAEMARVADSRLSDQTRIGGWLKAVEADNFSVEPWLAMARFAGQRALEHPEQDLWKKRLLTSTSSVVALRGHSSAAWSEMAGIYQKLYDQKPDPGLSDRILQLARGAAFLYPNSASIQAEYARALRQSGDTGDARRVASRALELDELTPHADKKLSSEQKRRMQAILARPDETPATPSEPAVVE